MCCIGELGSFRIRKDETAGTSVVWPPGGAGAATCPPWLVVGGWWFCLWADEGLCPGDFVGRFCALLCGGRRATRPDLPDLCCVGLHLAAGFGSPSGQDR
jgi:hypothetical protein